MSVVLLQKTATTAGPTVETTAKPDTTVETTAKPDTSINPETTVEPEDPCKDKNCHHGTCVVDEDNQGVCECEEGWEGANCNKAITTLAPKTTTHTDNPCDDKDCTKTSIIGGCPHCTGVCELNEDDGHAQCVCEQGWTGDNCTEQG